MTESEWNECGDAIAMLEFALSLRGIKSDSHRHKMGYRMNSGAVETSDDFETCLHRFYVACCRNIWRLLPDPDSRNGIEIAEKWLHGSATDSELNQCDRDVEGAAFGIDYKSDPEELKRWIADVEMIAEQELKSMIHLPSNAAKVSAHDLLRHAAYFASFATMYPAIHPKGLPPENYHLFLSPDLLREHVKYSV